MTNPLLSMFVFPAPQPSYTMHSFPNELLWMPWVGKDKRSDLGPADYAKCRTGDCIPAIVLRSPAARYMVIYLHSNGEDIGLAYPFGCGLRMVLEVHVLLVEYPGYGICPGECSEETMWETAQSALRFATETLGWPLEDVIIMGRSIGASVATRVACTYACHGLILVAPFLSLVDAVTQYVGALAPMIVSPSAFSTKELIINVNMPMLIIHGMQDRLINCSQGQSLWELCPHKKKLLVCPETMSHNTDLLSNADYLIRPMLRFFALPDYCFVDLVIPPEAFNKRHCPNYHTLVETVKGDRPLLRPQGDEEPCPVGVTSAGPSSVFGRCVSSGGDSDDLDGSNEFTVRTPQRSVSPVHRVRKTSSQRSLQKLPEAPEPSDVEENSPPNGGAPDVGPPDEFLEELHPLNMPESVKIGVHHSGPDDTPQESSITVENDAVPEGSSQAPRQRRTSGPVQAHDLPVREITGPDFRVDVQIINSPKAKDEVILDERSGEKSNEAIEGTTTNSEILVEGSAAVGSSCTVILERHVSEDHFSDIGSDRGHHEVPATVQKECQYVVGLPISPSAPSQGVRASPRKVSEPNQDTGYNSLGNSSKHEVLVETGVRQEETSKRNDSSSPSKLSTRTDSFEGPVAEEQDRDWTMPFVPADSLAGSDTEWPVHPGLMPTLMYGKPSQQRPSPHNLASTFIKPPALPSRSMDPTEANWEEGSTLPPTAEASHASRRTHELSDFRTMSEPDCVMAPVPGLCILNINDGISRFLHEGENLEQ